ncbi:hypothetical protein M409DRAFT_27832 [Zasmidium cellare ATCC 36951]|uniref:Uncharacterized protein n=1 Tax=Zasmidium cellare ATCC 36951 TaxID=1080233 RepID=A0A6A6C8L9_ZASCE|nr:uncharacterized protein M409DRAFT_27832 [Zasmidium cellare ATCC 36951]KAF2161776.1 hypothetical protein M409DRAFT_27832 [Zasmidium cellare ATCC 36951]
MPPSSPQNAPADAATKPDQPKPRRFAPEPIETTTKSSKSARRHSPEKQDAPKARRFAPEPIETTTKSSRKNPESTQDNKSKPRRFAPEPIETTHKSSKGRSDEKSSSSHIRFKPQLVETQYGGNRKPSRQTSMESDASTVASEDATPRKFTPVVLSTAKRSRRVGDSNAVNYQDYKTEEGHTIHAREHQKHAGWKTPDFRESKTEANDHAHNVSDAGHELIPPDMKRPVSPLDGSAPPRPAALNATRSHSFRLPDLDTIESSESERESGPSSMSCSPGQGSPITASDSSFNEFYKHATRIRESVDENFSNYFLQLEARKAEQRLQEQALAAFPNSDFHEPVQHYVNDDQDSLDDEIEDRPVTWEGFDEEEYLVKIRRESTKEPWEQLEMQRHAEKMEQERNANKVTAKKESHSPWWNPDAAPSIHQPDNEMRSMRDRARPPMLGRDLVFPRCPSPEPARFDVTQGSDKLRQQMCYLNEQSQSAQVNEDEGGLWNAAPKNAVQSTASSISSPSKGAAGKGLWGGCCIGGEEQQSTNNGLMPPSGPTGLMTPAPRTDSSNPFEQSFAAGGAVVHTSLAAITTPPSPPASLKGADIAHLDAVLVSERDFDEMFSREYPDAFVTQVFNYLSLGYPSLARPFDDELSKISRIPVPELRQDDVKAKQSPRGYIRLGQDFEGGGGEGISEDSCVRWQALKLYIREWARQEKNMVRVDAPGGNWATTNRRGSWAI